MEFEWDEDKRQRNLRDHKIDFKDALSVFFDPNAIDEEDIEIYTERRYRTIGMSREGELLFVVYTWRRDAVRLISARRAESHEKRKYHEN